MEEIILDASRNSEYMEDMKEKGVLKEPEDKFTQAKRKLQSVYISPEEEAQLREMYSHVVVQDFEDEYHMPREEREKMRAQYEKFFRLRNNYTKKIRQIDVFIEACRLCLDIVRDIAENDKIMSPEKFVKMALRGDIEINGVNFPKYQGKGGKKRIDWNTVAAYILDDTKDPKALLDISDPRAAIEEEYLTAHDTFTEEELDKILGEGDPEMEKAMEQRGFFNEEDYGGRVAVFTSKKMLKELMKASPSYQRVVKDMCRREDVKRKSNAMIWELDQNDMKYIEEYDAKISGKKKDGPPEFKGSIMNEDDVNAYLYAMEQYERETTLVEYNGRYITQEELDDIKYKQMLEENGWNLRNLYGNRDRAKKRKDQERADQKKIKRLKKMLEKIQERKDANKESDGLYEDKKSGVNTKKKKAKKKSKKKSKQYDELILDAAGVDDDDIEGYKKRMENMVWDLK